MTANKKSSDDDALRCKLSVCMITYNHGLYVEEALNGIIMQNSDFDIELVIGDDASTDNTVAIINSITFPPHIKLKKQFRRKNVGMLRNFTSTLQECTGRYIALLDGDDYWIDPNKLQRQAGFLDGNPEFSICYHPVNIYNGRSFLDDNNNNRDVSDIYDLAHGNFMHTCSVVFRSGLFSKFPSEFYKSTVADYFLHMLNAKYGKIKKIPYIMGVYRMHEDGVWSMQPNMDIKILTYLEAMIGCFQSDVEEILKKRHQEISYRSFYNRIEEDGFDERLLRCTKYGSAFIKAKFGKLISADIKQNGSLRSGIVRYLKSKLNF